ncbi:MAG: hypothetical protein ACO3BI_03375 [Candidatus Nanopelagicales bacterium]
MTMKVFQYLPSAIIGILIYLIGIYLISGDFNLTPLTEFAVNFEAHQNDLLNTGVTLLFLLVISKILLSLLSRIWHRGMWLGIVLLIAGTLASALLLLEYITFLDLRLLKITSVLLATLTVVISLLSLLAALTRYRYRSQREGENLLYKLWVRNPQSLMFLDKARSSEILLAPVIFLSYLVLLHFDSVYSGDEAIYKLNVSIYTFVFFVLLLVLVYASLRHSRRLLR